MIEVHQLSKTFRVHRREAGFKAALKSLWHRQWIEKHALKNVSLSIGPGEIVGLVGANGAGKTTLVKALSGILHPTSGEAKVLGHTPWERSTDFRRQIALVMGQKAQLWWDLPAHDCFLLLKEIYQIPDEHYKKNIEYLTESLDVTKQLGVQIRRLSLGERMKMELIAALLHQPKVVFLDEPTIGLDITAQKAIRRFLLEYRRTHRPAMILTSHYMEDIESLCERIMIIRDGEFVYDGALSNIIKRYADHKILRVVLSDGTTPTLPEELGVVIRSNNDEVVMKVPRVKMADTMAYVMKSWPVSDVDIQNEDIADIIESLMRRDS